MGHLGLLPQSVHALGGYRVQGKTLAATQRVLDDALALQEAGVGCSVHWRPLHLHPYYQERFSWTPEQFPVATREWLEGSWDESQPGERQPQFARAKIYLTLRWGKSMVFAGSRHNRGGEE